MPIEYRNRTEVFRHSHANGDIVIARANCVQTWDGKIITDLGQRYLVEQGEWMIPTKYYDNAEEIANEIYAGKRVLGEAAEEAAKQ